MAFRGHAARLAWVAGHVALLALAAPSSVRAADPPPVSGIEGSAPLIIILLLGSLTAGIFFASPLRRPVGDGPAAIRLPVVDSVLDAVGQRVAERGRRYAPPTPTTPLPPILGGDIFFDDEPGAEPARPAAPPPAMVSDADPLADRVAAPRWSTAPPSPDRYRPYG